MQLQETIKRAVEVVGSQRELARLIGEREQHISDFKRGRPCSYQKHAEIAAVAGMHEEARHILIAGMAESLRDDVEHEAQAKAGLLAILQAFPLKQTTTRTSDESQQKQALLKIKVLTQYRVRPGIFSPIAFVNEAANDDQAHPKFARCG